jgi:two-component system cell cycle response regulator CtrA
MDKVQPRQEGALPAVKPAVLGSVNIGDIVIDSTNKRIDGVESARISGKKLRLLNFFAENADVTMTRSMILDHLYGGVSEPEQKIIDVFVCKIRKLLEKTSKNVRIHSVWGRGYVLRIKTT